MPTDMSEGFSIQGEVAKADPDQKLVFGWAYVVQDKDGKQQVDKSGEFVSDPTELEKAAYSFVLQSRVGGDRHVSKSVSTLVESIVFTKEKREAMGIPDGVLPTGWWTGWKVHDDEVWKKLKKGERAMFSIHGKGLRKKVSAA